MDAAAALDLCPWLDGHGVDLRGLLLAHGRLLKFAPRQWVFGEGDDSGGIVVVVNGTVQIYAQAPGGREVLLSQTSRGGAFGQSALFGGGPRLVTAISQRDSVVLHANDRALGEIARQQPLIWRAAANLQYMLLRGMVQMIAEFTSLSPRQRLAARIMRFASGTGSASTVALSQQDLADMTGLSRKTVNACLAELEAGRVIQRGYATIEILDMPALKGFVREHEIV